MLAGASSQTEVKEKVQQLSHHRLAVEGLEGIEANVLEALLAKAADVDEFKKMWALEVAWGYHASPGLGWKEGLE